MEEKKVKSLCLGDISIINIVKGTVFVIAIVAGISIYYANTKDLPEKIAKQNIKIDNNSNNISTLRADYSGMKATVDGIDKKIDLIIKFTKK